MSPSLPGQFQLSTAAHCSQRLQRQRQQYRGIATSRIERFPKPDPSSSKRPHTPPPGIDAAKLYRDRAAAGGPFTWRAAALFAATGTGLYLYFVNEKKKIETKKKQEVAAQKVGRPKIGGPFKLTSQNGTEFTEQDLLGKFSLVYFGFTNCPDICPEELDKMTTVVNQITSKHGAGSILPIFITCDPARDDVKAVKAYCKDFHPTLVGLTGSYNDIKKTCKTFRVYFSTPPDAKPQDDYLVDHSIFFYLMDPTGQFVDAFGRSISGDDVTAKVDGYMKEWKAGVRRGDE
ncbi:MAG: Cu-binding protein [Cyphobasidiales sp. Tagirdzhanova-0007]|nr:MAG: Cu-binding protein [Cyphobasidiales sp. Tagirdzhanova-0007]